LALTLAAGNAGNLNSGTLAAARMSALTGDCTTSAGAVATTCTKINGVDQTTAWMKPTITCGTGALTSGSATGAYKTLGKTVSITIQLTITKPTPTARSTFFRAFTSRTDRAGRLRGSCDPTSRRDTCDRLSFFWA
jgi:outer membrane scaffolding protein for murein synthesis (MipA/OmpV family)